VHKDGRTADTSLSQLANLASEAFVGYDHNAHAVAVFVATMLQESAWLATTVEYGDSPKTYDPYRGRTFEQLTHKSNYAGFGQWCFDNDLIPSADYFVNSPEELGALKFAWLGGTWYFDNRKLWSLASSGDFQRVQTAVNFGTATTTKVPSGWFPRLRAYRSFLSAYVKPKAVNADGTMESDTRKRLQEFIGAAIDGDWGQQTWFLMGEWLELNASFNINSKTHVKALQKKVGLTGNDVDGVWYMPVSKKYGPTTTKALQAYLNKYR
jgi:predicted chitinase